MPEDFRGALTTRPKVTAESGEEGRLGGMLNLQDGVAAVEGGTGAESRMMPGLCFGDLASRQCRKMGRGG